MDRLSIPVRRLYHGIRSEFIRLQFRWQILCRFYGSDQETIDLLETTANYFFRVYESDLQDAIVLGFGRLTDPPETFHRKNASLEQLIDLLGGLHPDLTAKLKEHLAVIRNTCKDIKDYRNQWTAHRDYQTALSLDPGSTLRIKRQDIENALSELQTFLNEFEQCFSDPHWEPDHSLPLEEQARQVSEYDDLKIPPPTPNATYLFLGDGEDLIQSLREGAARATSVPAAD